MVHQHKHNNTTFTQQRYVASNKKKKGNKASGGSGNSKKPIKYQPIFHPNDLDDDVDVDGIIDYCEEAKDFDQLVRDMTVDYGFEREQLEMLDDNLNWKKLTSKNLKQYKGKVVKIRDKELFEDEEEYDPEDGDEDEDYASFDYEDKDMISMREEDKDHEKKSKTEDKSLRLKIAQLVAEMKYNGYERQDTSTLRKASTGESIGTKEYVLSKAAEDEELLTFLVEKIGALDHIVQWTHFDAVWNNIEIGDESDHIP